MSDELTSELRELAAAGEKPPTLTGAEIRGRAVRRRRRRRTAMAAAGTSVAGALALVLTLSLDGGTHHDPLPPPAASPAATPSVSPAAPDATIDLGRRVVSVAGRELTLASDTPTGYAPTLRSTVTRKEASMRVSGKTVGFGDAYSFRASWAIELTAPDGTTDYVGSMTPDENGSYDPSLGWIGLREADAKWLYEQLAPGSVVEIKPSSGGPSSPNPTAVDGDRTTAGTVSGTGAPGSGTSGSGTSGG